tara:strand:+ start:1476 stop:2408 length:933 start_codon:yes stop_codon:yes gene_type:complete
MLLKLAGVTFATDRNTKLKKLQPSGAVSFEAEPDNEHDSNAVKVMYKGEHIGYVPKSPEAQAECLKIGVGKIIDYAYYDSDLKFNQKHIGQFQAMTFEVGEVEIDNGKIIGGQYLRCTQFLKYFDPYGSSEGLIKWAFNQGDTYEAYEEALNLAAENGTAMHEAIECYFRKEDYDADHLPKGWDNFVAKYYPVFVWGEERFYDNELMVTGQPDFAGYIEYKGKRVPCLLDWKSSKRPSKKHEIQISIYAMNSKVDDQSIEGAMVVAFGSDNKQGFATKWVTREQIESNYQGCLHIKKAMECIGCYVSNYY